MSETLYRKYRPKTFAEIVGQEHIVTALQNAIKFDKLGHAYLLTGPRGTGKTTLARLIAKAANCTNRKNSEPCGACDHCRIFDEGRFLDVIEIDAATHTGVDNIRELRETVAIPPSSGRYKIYIIDEAHMLSAGAWNALLKTLEEPPAHAIFILATTAIHKVPETIVSRCQRFDFSRFSVEEIVLKLSRIAESEKLTVEDGALRLIALAAEGGMRDAESLLTQVATLQESPITEEDAAVILGLTSHGKVESFTMLLANRDLRGSLAKIQELSLGGENFIPFAGSLLRYFRAILLASIDPTVAESELASFTDEQKKILLQLAGSFTPKDTVRLLELFQEAEQDLKTSPIAELPLEIATVKFLSKNREQRIENKNEENKEADEPIKKVETKMENKTENTKQETKKPSINNEKDQLLASSFQPTKEKGKEATLRKSIEETKTKKTSISLSDVKSKWRDIIREATRLNASLTLALTNAHPVETKGPTITIAVRFPFHKDRLAEPKARLTLKTAFDTILKTETHISVIVDNTPIEKETTADSSLVAQALSMLGGKVV